MTERKNVPGWLVLLVAVLLVAAAGLFIVLASGR